MTTDVTTQTGDPSRRRFIRSTSGVIIAAALPLSGCDLLGHIPDAATAAWTTAGQGTDIRVKALSYAILAPNPHNRQPWLVDLDEPGVIRLHIDHKRLLPHTDPFGRQILIGTGAMLGLLEIASRAMGYQVDTTLDAMQRFDPSGSARPIATVRISDTPGKPSPVDRELFAQILNRRTDRRAYDPGRAVPDDLLTTLAAMTPGSLRTGVLPAREKAGHEVSQVVRDAWRIELETPRTMMESIELLRVGGSEIATHRDGISISDPMLVLLDRVGLFDRSAPPAPGSSALNGMIDDFAQAIASTPGFFWITSASNRPLDQLDTGRLYVKSHLVATALGMVMQPVSQALQEYPEMKQPYQRIHQLLARDGETLQMLCRAGYLPANTSTAPAAPRRGLREHLLA